MKTYMSVVSSKMCKGDNNNQHNSFSLLISNRQVVSSVSNDGYSQDIAFNRISSTEFRQFPIIIEK